VVPDPGTRSNLEVAADRRQPVINALQPIAVPGLGQDEVLVLIAIA
jgi:hypothetical protein